MAADGTAGYSLGDVLKLHGLTKGLAGGLGELLAGAEHGAGENHHLATVPVVETVWALAGEDVGGHKGDVL
jgi:hypothetical protein